MVLTEIWVELKTDDGRVYFWNRRDNSRAWSLPEGQEAKWIGEKTGDGRTYYWSRKSKETVWVLPALEPEKAAQEEPEGAQKKGALASLLRGEKPKEDEKVESSSEDLKKQQQALQEALLNSLPGDEAKPEPSAASVGPEAEAEAKEPQKDVGQAEADAGTAAATTAAAMTAAATGFPGVNPMGMGMGATLDPMQAMMMAQMGMAPGCPLPGLMMPGLGGLPMPGMMPGLPGVMPGMPLPGLPSMPGMMGMPGAAATQPAPQAVQPVQPVQPPPAAIQQVTAPSFATPAPAMPQEPVQEPYEEHPYLEEEEEVASCPPPEGLPGPKGESASAIAARHVIEAAGVDTWFLKLPEGEWEEVVRFWPPLDELDMAKPPKLKKKPKLDKWKSRSLLMRCQRHEELVRAMLVAQYSTSRSFSVVKYPCPLSNEWCFWGSDGRQILCEEPELQDGKKIPPNFERNPPEGQRCKLMQNKTRSQLSMVFKAQRLRHLERALMAKHHRRSQALLQELGSASVPEVLKVAGKKLGSDRPDEPLVKAMPKPPKVQEPTVDATGGPSPVSPKAEDSGGAAPWKKRRLPREKDKVTERPGKLPSPPTAPPVAEVVASPEETKNVKDLLPRKVLLSNVPQNATVKELSDFFTGAIFTATGHTLGENHKVVELVELQNGHAEVLFATPLSASIAVALHGMNFQNKVLGIRRPPGFSGPPLNRAKLLTVAMKDLVSDVSDQPMLPVKAQASVPSAYKPGAAVVKISGIPASMTGSSIFDCLQQFGGPLKSLSLTTNRETGEHNGSGTAEFVEHSAAVEACRFSPFFGFIEVTLQEPTAKNEEAPRRSRWSEEAEEMDLGPFNEVLPPKPSASLARATSKAAPKKVAKQDLDLGPFNDVLPPGPAEDDLGPFSHLLPPKVDDDLDLGPFNAVLPPRF